MIHAIVLLLLGVQPASAAPLSPGSLQPVPLSVELAGTLSTDRFYLHSPGCTGDACSAIRKELWQGGEAALWFIPQLGIYGGLAHETEATGAATYSGAGFRAHAGVKGGVALGRGVGLNGWASVTHTETSTTNTLDSVVTGAPDQAKRNQFEVGAVAQFGQADGGIQAWTGIEAMPFSVDRTRVVQGEAMVILQPFIPISAVAGVRMMSDPVGGPWVERGRIGVGVTGELGYRVGVTGWLMVSM